MKNLIAYLLIICTILTAFSLASCKGVKHKVKFMVDEKEYYTFETKGKENIKMPKVPTKKGFVFDGWYFDDETFKKMFLSTSLKGEVLSENIFVYAKWEKDGETVKPKDTSTYSYPMDTVIKLEGAIKKSTNQYIIGENDCGAVIDLADIEYNTVKITKSDDVLSFTYTFLKELPVGDEIPEYASGYSKAVFDDNDFVTVSVPSDAKYLYLNYLSGNLSYLPKSVEFSNSATTEKKSPRSFTVATWNVGHFSDGKLKSSEISESEYKEKSKEYKKYIKSLGADIICFNEYSDMFTSSVSTVDALFDKAPQVYLEGAQYNYSCNAVFSSLPLNNISVHNFECNKTNTITHTSAIKATDYYYITGQLTVGDETIDVVFTHLAFDENKIPDTVCTSQMDELIQKFADSKHVIMMGDWNAYFYRYFNRFKDNGYTLGNKSGKIKTCTGSKTGKLEWAVDNIVVKGLEIDNFHAKSTKLSDHVAVVATITLAK